MPQFDTTKWFKNQYLTEAGLNEEKSKNERIFDVFYDELEDFDGVAEYLNRYKSMIIRRLESIDFDYLPKPSMMEEAESNDIEKLDFSFVDGTNKLYAVDVYKKNNKGIQWDKKLSRKEAQELLKSNNIDIEIHPDNIDKIDDAFKDIKVTQSEFDVS